MFAVVVGSGLKTRTAAAHDLHDLARLLERLDFALNLGVELQNVQLLDSVFEKAVDDREEKLQAPVGNGPAYIYRDKQVRREFVAAAHRVETGTAVGPHAREAAPARDDRGLEQTKHLAVVHVDFQACLDEALQLARDGAPVVARGGDFDKNIGDVRDK